MGYAAVGRWCDALSKCSCRRHGKLYFVPLPNGATVMRKPYRVSPSCCRRWLRSIHTLPNIAAGSAGGDEMMGAATQRERSADDASE